MKKRCLCATGFAKRWRGGGVIEGLAYGTKLEGDEEAINNVSDGEALKRD